MKKDLLISLSCAAIVLIALNGCGAVSKMSDSTIRNAIQESNTNYSKYDLSIQDLSFDSRNYDKQEKTEAVTVTVVAENENTTYTVSYDVLGKLSDKNWRIVSVTPLSEDIKPKNALTYEDVTTFSDKLIKAAQGSGYNEPCQMHIQDYTIDSDTSSTTGSATILLSADTQCFSVKRECLAIFNYNLDGWSLSDTSVGDYTVALNESALTGTWSCSSSSGKSYSILTVDHTDGSSIYATYNELSQSFGYVFSETHINDISEFKLDMENNLYFEAYTMDSGREYRPNFVCRDEAGNFLASFSIDPENDSTDSPIIWDGNDLIKE